MAKICRNCKKKFEPRNSMQIVCSPKCAYEYKSNPKAKEHVKKAKRREYREQKIASKTLATLLKETQKEFNAYIRLRDKDEPCISCGRTDPPSTRAGQWHAGHYRTVGAHPELRFTEENCNKECLYCNNFNSDHLEGYRINLIIKIGLERVEWLEGYHEPAKWDRQEVIDLKLKYRKLTRDLQSSE